MNEKPHIAGASQGIRVIPGAKNEPEIETKHHNIGWHKSGWKRSPKLQNESSTKIVSSARIESCHESYSQSI